MFAAGSSEGCPILWMLPLLSGAQWQSRDLAPKSDGSKCSHMVNESIVQKLQYIEQDRVLVMAGDFDYVDGTRANNIALSRDAGTHTHTHTHTHTQTHTHTHTHTRAHTPTHTGRTWNVLSHAGLHEGVSKAEGSQNKLLATVTALVLIPQMDVSAVLPPHVPPLGRATITLLGAGFNAFPRAMNPFAEGQQTESAVVLVGSSRCQAVTWVADSSITCRVLPGFGESLKVFVGLPPGGDPQPKFARQHFRFSYSAPRLGTADSRLTEPVAGSLGGRETMTVLGSNFGGESRFVSASIGESSCSQATWISDSSLTCSLAPGAGRTCSMTFNIIFHSIF